MQKKIFLFLLINFFLLIGCVGERPVGPDQPNTNTPEAVASEKEKEPEAETSQSQSIPVDVERVDMERALRSSLVLDVVHWALSDKARKMSTRFWKSQSQDEQLVVHLDFWMNQKEFELIVFSDLRKGKLFPGEVFGSLNISEVCLESYSDYRLDGVVETASRGCVPPHYERWEWNNRDPRPDHYVFDESSGLLRPELDDPVRAEKSARYQELLRQIIKSGRWASRSKP